MPFRVICYPVMKWCPLNFPFSATISIFNLNIIHGKLVVINTTRLYLNRNFSWLTIMNEILCNFLVRPLKYIFFKFEKKLPIKTKKNTLNSSILYGPIFSVDIANWLKISPNIIFCSIKMAPCATWFWQPLQSFYPTGPNLVVGVRIFCVLKIFYQKLVFPIFDDFRERKK